MNDVNRPSKKIRLSTSAAYDHIPDIEKVRQKNDLRLKGRFQAIFDKYDRDFSGVGDEIDLVTGEVVVDNGHLSSMRHTHDTGRKTIRKAIDGTAQKNLGDEHDELLPPTAAPKVKSKSFRDVDSNLIANGIAMAITADQQPFDPADPMSVAELGKNIALQIAHLLQKPETNRHQSSPITHSSSQHQQVMTPPVSEPEISSPFFSRSHREQVNEQSINQHSLCGRFDSIWGGQVRSESPVLQEDTLPEKVGEGSRKISVQAITKFSAQEVPPRKAQSRQKWSQEDKDKLSRLRAEDRLTWSQIVEHFPGRSLLAVQKSHEALLKKAGNAQCCGQDSTSSPRQTSSDALDRSHTRQSKRACTSSSLMGETVSEPRPETVPRTKLVAPSVRLPLDIKQTFSHVLIPSRTAQRPRILEIEPSLPETVVNTIAKAIPNVIFSKAISKKPKSKSNRQLMHKHTIAEDLGSDDELG